MSTAPQDQSASPWPRGSIPYSLNIHNPQGSKRPSLRESPECSRCCSLAQLTTNIGRSASASSLTLQKDQGCCLQGGGHRWAENIGCRLLIGEVSTECLLYDSLNAICFPELFQLWPKHLQSGYYPYLFYKWGIGWGPQRRGKGLLRGPSLIARQSEAKLASCLLRLSYVADSVWDVKTS